MNQTKKYLLDTSVILDDPTVLVSLYQNGANELYISDIILKELNGHKEDAINEKGFLAREFIRALEKGEYEDVEDYQEHSVQVKKEGDSIHTFPCKFEGYDLIFVHAITRDNYKNSREINDTKILEVAKSYGLHLLTNDISLKVIALSKKVASSSLRKNSVQKPELILFNKEFVLEDGENIDTVMKEIAEEKDFNQITLSLPDGKKRFFTPIKNSLVEHKMDAKDFSKYRISPINLEQKFLLRMLSSPYMSIAVVTGSTGSGKTLMALQEGLRRVNNKDDAIEKIVYCRNTVTSNDKASELGFRKGDQSTKLNFFGLPLFGNINFILSHSISDKKLSLKDDYQDNSSRNSNDIGSETEQFMKDNCIEIMDIAHIRGITLSNTYLIIDEGQNMSDATLQLIGTRAGKNTKIVLLGDFRQVDHPYLSKNRNALVTMLQKAQKDNSIAAIQLQKTIRSEVAAWFQDNFS